eukprot:PhM_4_TR6224/c0_g1_i3/m.74766/K02910/RP-L31e, RPL31; large subunit ribosomal protein L31e
MVSKTNTKRKYLPAVVTLETTVHLARNMKDVGPKRRAPRACKVVKEYAKKMLGTSDNRIDVKLNKALWSKGIKNIPHRIRVRMSRKVRETTEDGKRGGGKYYTVISYVSPADGTFKG